MLPKLKVTLYCDDPDDSILAVRAVKAAIAANQYDTIIKFEDGSKFYVYVTNSNNWVARKVGSEEKCPTK